MRRPKDGATHVWWVPEVDAHDPRIDKCVAVFHRRTPYAAVTGVSHSGDADFVDCWAMYHNGQLRGRNDLAWRPPAGRYRYYGNVRTEFILRANEAIRRHEDEIEKLTRAVERV
jgi:hypothetical protein